VNVLPDHQGTECADVPSILTHSLPAVHGHESHEISVLKFWKDKWKKNVNQVDQCDDEQMSDDVTLDERVCFRWREIVPFPNSITVLRFVVDLLLRKAVQQIYSKLYTTCSELYN